MTKNDASYETILLSLEGGIARLTLNRPDKLNSFNVRMHEEVQRALQSVRGQGARVLVLSGAGRGFCAGQDLADRAVAPGTQGVDLGDGHAFGSVVDLDDLIACAYQSFLEHA